MIVAIEALSPRRRSRTAEDATPYRLSPESFILTSFMDGRIGLSSVRQARQLSFVSGSPQKRATKSPKIVAGQLGRGDPWARALIQPHYPKTGQRRQPPGLATRAAIGLVPTKSTSLQTKN